ncbi:CHASE3 domain-containing protein [Sphingopyxis sp. KK2]|uniref:CHASE3 domain-containing protein n=1 Tax=Sphingopyxis sp. KK2 TaxID=1855727 RepID=UPI00097E584A|nr:CHASE3 domain-containing protein [Sphingopyxis sp. KK2]
MRKAASWQRAVMGNWVLIVTGAGAFLILFFLSLATDGGFEQNARLRQQVSNSYDARAALQGVLTRHQDIELGQRGYVITGDPQFLTPYRAAEARIDSNLDLFAKLAGSEGKGRLIDELRRTSAEKRRFVAHTIEMVESGQRDEAARLIAGGEGKRSMDHIRALISEISEAERQKLEERTLIANAARERLRARTFTLQIGLILLLALAAVLIGRSQWARKKAHRRARDLAARQEAIFDSAKDGMIVLNPSGSIESLNPSAARMFGVPSESLLRRDIGSLFEIAPDRGQIETFLRRLKANRKESYGQIQEFVGRRQDGATFPLEVSVSPVDLADGTLFVAVIRDISDRREVEQMKSEFVATVSHELRTPLTSIAGALGLISGGAAGEIPAKAARLVDIAHSNAARLVRLINDILDIEKIEAGRMQFDIRPLALGGVLEAAAHQVAGFAGEYGVTVEIEPVAPEAAVLADEDRLMQVITNLLSNAIKFSRRGGTVTMRVAPLDRRYRISVIDRGEGIPEAFRSRIFGKFAQADASDSRAKGGTGLGLSIVREIVVRLGGSVSFDSVEGTGSIFHVDLPIAELPGLAAPVQVAEAPQPGEGALPVVLHVDDDPDMLAVVASAFDGQAAIESTPSIAEARAAIARRRYDAAILDVGMLDGNGTDLVAPLRKRSPGLPIVLFTAQEVGGAPKADIDLILVKSRASLDTLVHEVTGRIAAQRAQGGGGK